MPRNHAPPDKADPQMNDPVDRWDDEGGAAARPVSEALLERVNELTPLKRQVLECLGAAVVLAWNELPTDVQRTLFRLASADAESAPASELPARIARFLHDHKDDAGTR
jgi:hypothetical protein